MATFDSKKLEKAIMKKTNIALQKRTYSVTCPHCKKTVTTSAGKHPCPNCNKLIDLVLEINIK